MKLIINISKMIMNFMVKIQDAFKWIITINMLVYNFRLKAKIKYLFNSKIKNKNVQKIIKN